jgi:tetratricopeptide (TPR) repeat protein
MTSVFKLKIVSGNGFGTIGCLYFPWHGWWFGIKINREQEIMADNNKQAPRITNPSEIAKWVKYHCDQGIAGHKRGVSFLIGAGFSASAGIPTAAKIVKEKLEGHPLLKDTGRAPAEQSQYAFLMSKLPPAERIKIIRDAIKQAEDSNTNHLRINWSHLLLATLVDAGYVNLILTTNFDPLIVEALAVTGQPVRAFDLTASAGFQTGALEPSSVIYLHGQAHGLWLTNAPDEMARVEPHLNSVFQDALLNSVLIVVGYSGECDPVFRELVKAFPQFRHRLYWIHYDQTDPCDDVMKLLTHYYREAYLVQGYDADRFMREFVLEGLKLELPRVVRTPLDSINLSLQRIMPFPQRPDEPAANDPVTLARDFIAQATIRLKSGGGPTNPALPENILTEVPVSIAIAMAGAAKNFEKLRELRSIVENSKNHRLMQLLGDAWLGIASNFCDQKEFSAAFECLKTVDMLGSSEPHWLATVWGNVLSGQAKTKSGEEADHLFKQSHQKFLQALTIKPNMYEALNNWGNALYHYAKIKNGKGAEMLFKLAYEKFSQALKIKPDLYETLTNWANALWTHARTKNGAEADQLFLQSSEKFAQALKIKPDAPDAMYNLGSVLSDQAKTKIGKEADELYLRAFDQYYQALKINPKHYESLNNWGTALLNQAKTKSGSDADAIFQKALDKYTHALKIKPDFCEAYFNLACIAALKGNIVDTCKNLIEWKKLNPNARQSQLDDDTDFDCVRKTPEFRRFRNSLPK